MLRLTLLASLLLAANLANAVEPLEDGNLTSIAGNNGVQLGTRHQQGAAPGPQVGHPSQDAKERAAGDMIETLDNQLESARSQQPVLANDLREKSGDATALLPDSKGAVVFPKTVNTESLHKPEVPASLGTFKQTNVQIEGGIRFGGGR